MCHLVPTLTTLRKEKVECFSQILLLFSITNNMIKNKERSRKNHSLSENSRRDKTEKSDLKPYDDKHRIHSEVRGNNSDPDSRIVP